MRWQYTLLVALALLVPAAGQSQHLQLGADFGVTRLEQEGPLGVAGNLYPGVGIGPLTAEVQLGYHYAADGYQRYSGPRHGTVYAPVMAGGRIGLPLGLAKPWVGAHGGVSYVAHTDRDPYTGFRYTRDNWEPAFNVGAGLDVWVGIAYVGAAVWYNAVLDDYNPMRTLSGSVSLTFVL